MDTPTKHKALISPPRATMYDCSESSVRRALDAVMSTEATIRLASPFGQLGEDVFGRMREFNKARMGFDPETVVALA
ncbi:hypothetical protein [Mesorhizobium sp. INR15]|uniref:hypothetical protein n=1 Tax=Mesorhizobium sp. INR15 TaxID=2654248 RepID=UPI0018968ECE|nr:hypothetical protein [Mesorhizobium sp. INR15]QPC95523.1 hypothetical protein GA829_33570 [Mesorhizobium sp. INR15]